ncbi:serine hydroxymethyltransferase [Phycisphaera mikurensis]|uniref:Serine hydroxymethyltransferase n=1 Tax=Phycisphaera mikurensis (strain NBRC 102666 / KCTC 22515 / FYK2301M01) TaxID=1142394 RepID=I0IBB4_PHYMF|nr:serine hydroxymethyltransferase [Phycisphaera mikurensis]MBB6443047.1 glycine hydroxymethyltransferase [Phycisphaera mikurensis]BAM02552.1 serine hydroxymethyltransferase [Phycisphaera mikurensis NBRC 102666]
MPSLSVSLDPAKPLLSVKAGVGEPAPAGVSALQASDPEIAALVAQEKDRQHRTLEMIASENHASHAVMEAQGSCLTNKYAEGYPGKRYYSGCAFHDEVETLAIERAKRLFGCGYANVQPHSGASANLAVQLALFDPGDTFAAIELSDGGHLTHGSPVNLSGKWLNPVTYNLVTDESREDWGHLDYDSVDRVCAEHKPKVLMTGYSAYPRTIDFARFREIADRHGAILWADVAHIAGLIAGGAHPSPFPHCHVVTTTTHKTLRGPRGGMILTDDADLAKRFNSAVFPGTQGGPLMHVIAAKAVAFGEDLQPSFRAYAEQVVANAKRLAGELMDRGYKLASNGTDNHLILVDLRATDPELTGKDAASWLERAGIIANMNTVPNETRSPFKTSGIRLGTPALTTRGLRADDLAEVAGFIDRVLTSRGDAAVIDAVRADVESLCDRFPRLSA